MMCKLFLFCIIFIVGTFATTTLSPPIYKFELVGTNCNDRATQKLEICVKPLNMLTLKLTITNDQPTLNFVGDTSMWPQATLTEVKPKSGIYQGTFKAPSHVGRHTLTWSVTKPKGTYYLSVQVDVTCSDGNMCNGMERWVENKCLNAAANLCDDFEPCTDDVCDAKTGQCSHTRNPKYTAQKCPDCKPLKCKPSCSGMVCGSDGCGGSCGSCSSSETCIDGKCDPSIKAGSCAAPFDLTAEAASLPTPWSGTIIKYDNNALNGLNVVAPVCNPASTAPELIYLLSPSQSIGLEVRMTGASGSPTELDTVLQVIQIKPTEWPVFNQADYPKLSLEDAQREYVRSNIAAGCVGANLNPLRVGTTIAGCSDDASPPGGLSSRVAYMMTAGKHYLIVADGYSAAQTGPFKLQITLSPDCALNCAGKYCGDSGCAGFSCGTCNAGFSCSDTFVCKPLNCVPDCSGRQCGSDGCGGSCGTCASGFACNLDTGKCRHTEVCNHMVPLCQNGLEGSLGCPAGQFCGSDCACHKLTERMFDLVLDLASWNPQIVEETFAASSCAVDEGCVIANGQRRLVRFSTNVINQGQAAFSPPNPPAEYPQLYQFANCHGHWHFSGFANFDLLNKDGKTLVSGRKQSYCAEDSKRILTGPGVNCYGTTNCENQGLSVGYVDIYGPDLDCQWLDITDIAEGDYIVRMCTNQLRTFEEANIDNNCATFPLNIPARAVASEVQLTTVQATATGAGATALIIGAAALGFIVIKKRQPCCRRNRSHQQQQSEAVVDVATSPSEEQLFGVPLSELNAEPTNY